MEVNGPKEKAVKKRLRLNPVVKWKDKDLKKVLTYMRYQETNAFERPSSLVYYTNVLIKCNLSQSYTWMQLYNKLKNMRMKYKKALEWKASIDESKFDGNSDKDWAATLNAICPYFDYIESFSSGKFEAAEADGESDAVPAGCSDISNEASIEIELEDSKIRVAEQIVYLQQLEKNRQEGEARMEQEWNESRIREQEEQHKDDDNVADENKDNHSNNLEVLEMLCDFQRQKMDRLNEKLQLERQKFENVKIELELKKEKLEFEKKKHEDNIILEKQKISEDSRLRELEISKKYQLLELELKLKYSKNF